MKNLLGALATVLGIRCKAADAYWQHYLESTAEERQRAREAGQVLR